MKTILTRALTVGAVGLLIMTGCKKSDLQVVSNGGQAGTLSANVSSALVLQKASINDTTKVIKFSFSKANYGFNAAVTNTLQIDKSGDNWAHPTSVTLSTNVLTQGYNT